MKIFEKIFNQSLAEDNSAGAGGVFGDADSMGHGGAIEMSDFWNKDDTRKAMGGKKKKKKEKNKKKNGEIEELVPMQRRPFNVAM